MNLSLGWTPRSEIAKSEGIVFLKDCIKFWHFGNGHFHVYQLPLSTAVIKNVSLSYSARWFQCENSSSVIQVIIITSQSNQHEFVEYQQRVPLCWGVWKIAMMSKTWFLPSCSLQSRRGMENENMKEILSCHFICKLREFDDTSLNFLIIYL